AWLGARRIVCMGDSNTYGLMVKPNETYPRMLQQLLNRDAQEVEVVNLGAPGINSSRMRSRLPQVLRQVDPRVVLLMVGANDLWPVPTPVDQTPSDWRYELWRRSRVFRLLYMLRTSMQREKFEVTFVLPKGTSLGSSSARAGAETIDLTWTGRASNDQ